jgi:hypothetical protein
MLSKTLATAFAATMLIAGASAMPAAAADFDDRGSYSNKRIYHPAPKAAARGYDEDVAPRYNRHRHDDWRAGYMRTVEARASYGGGYVPYYVAEWRAKREAIELWKSKVSSLYGEQFAHWRAASNQQVNCDGGRGTVSCTVSATPARGWNRWGWYGNDRRAAY